MYVYSLFGFMQNYNDVYAIYKILTNRTSINGKYEDH